MDKFLFNFKKQFAEDVRTGRKRQTVRAKRKDNRLPKIGGIASCYTGLRTRGVTHLIDAPIIRVQMVMIDFSENTIALDGERLRLMAAQHFAINDGFRSWSEMIDWFRKNHPDASRFKPHLFEGFVTYWEPPNVG